MTEEISKRIEACYKELARISNYHSNELTSYESMLINSAYYDLVDIFDKQRAEEWETSMRSVRYQE